MVISLSKEGMLKKEYPFFLFHERHFLQSSLQDAKFIPLISNLFL